MVGSLAAGGGAAWPASSCAIGAPSRAAARCADAPHPAAAHPAVTHHGSRAPRAGRVGRHRARCANRRVKGHSTSASVPVACPMAKSKAVCGGHSRTRRLGSDLQILWSANHDKPVPKLIVLVRRRPGNRLYGPHGEGQAGGQARSAHGEPGDARERPRLPGGGGGVVAWVILLSPSPRTQMTRRVHR